MSPSHQNCPPTHNILQHISVSPVLTIDWTYWLALYHGRQFFEHSTTINISNIDTHIHTETDTRSDTDTCIHTRARIYAHTHTYTCTHNVACHNLAITTRIFMHQKILYSILLMLAQVDIVEYACARLIQKGCDSALHCALYKYYFLRFSNFTVQLHRLQMYKQVIIVLWINFISNTYTHIHMCMHTHTHTYKHTHKQTHAYT